MSINWNGIQSIAPDAFVCGHCNNQVGGDRGWQGADPRTGQPDYRVYVCPVCFRPTFIEYPRHQQYPGVPYGEEVRRLPGELEPLYREVRDAMAASAFTLAVLGCRKILAHVAVDKGAKEGKKFIEYVDHLATAGYVPPDGRGWVDHIRNKGNDANHEIAMMSKQDGEEVVTFTSMLLKFVYELPGMLPQPPT